MIKLFGFLFVFLLFLSGCNESNFQKIILENEINIQDAKNFELLEYSEEPFIILGKNQKENNYLKIRLLSVKDKNQAIEEMKKSLSNTLSQFYFTKAAFPGQEKKAEDCERNSKPHFYHTPAYYLVTFVDKRFALCICQANIPFFKKAMAYYYSASSRKLILIEYFVDVQTSDIALGRYFLDNFYKFENLMFEKIEKE